MRIAVAIVAALMFLGCTPVLHSGGGGYGYAPPHYYAPPNPLPYYGASYGYGGGGYLYAPPHRAPCFTPRPYYGASYGYRGHVGVGAGAGQMGQHQHQQPYTVRHARPMR